jgi:hypothetical protein
VEPLPGRPANGPDVSVAAHAPANAAPASTTSPDTINVRGRRGLRACAPRGPRAQDRHHDRGERHDQQQNREPDSPPL